MSCGAVAGGSSLDGVDVAGQAVIQGVVTRDGEPVSTGYVRLLDRNGEFVAEVPTSADGEFRFFATTGDWTLRVLAPRAERAERSAFAQAGRITELGIDLAETAVLL